MDHYWGQVYNPESALVGGAVVSGYGKTGAAYYNPATISFVKKSAFSFNVSLMSFQRYLLTNTVEDEASLEVVQVVLQPRFIAALMQPKKLNKIVLEIVLLNRNNYVLDFAESVNSSYDVLAYPIGEENYFGALNYQAKFDERMYGVGGAQKLNEKFSLGMSAFLLYKSYRSSKEVTTTATPKSENVIDSLGNTFDYYFASARRDERIDYYNFRFLMKIGANYQTNKFGLGLNVTLPSLNLYSQGSVYREFSQSNIDLPNQNEITKDIFISDYQTKLKSNYKDPLSIAVGAHIIDKRRFYSISLEYFARINEYKAISANENVLSTTDEVYASLKQKDFLSVYYAAKPVFNVAVGHKRYLSDNLLLYAGFRTDFSSKDELTERNKYFSQTNNLFKYNVYHVSTGVDFVFHKTSLIFGLQYSISRAKNLRQLTNFDNPEEYNYTDDVALQGDKTDTMGFKYDALSLYIGLTYSFFRKVTGLE